MSQEHVFNVHAPLWAWLSDQGTVQVPYWDIGAQKDTTREWFLMTTKLDVWKRKPLNQPGVFLCETKQPYQPYTPSADYSLALVQWLLDSTMADKYDCRRGAQAHALISLPEMADHRDKIVALVKCNLSNLVEWQVENLLRIGKVSSQEALVCLMESKATNPTALFQLYFETCSMLNRNF